MTVSLKDGENPKVWQSANDSPCSLQRVKSTPFRRALSRLTRSKALSRNRQESKPDAKREISAKRQWEKRQFSKICPASSRPGAEKSVPAKSQFAW